jgi:hypothetical protein
MRAAAALVVALVFLAGPPDITPARVPEDSAEWDCRNHGNRVCGPGNHQGVPAGNYSSP